MGSEVRRSRGVLRAAWLSALCALAAGIAGAAECPVLGDTQAGVRLSFADGSTETVWPIGPATSTIEIRDANGAMLQVHNTTGGAFLHSSASDPTQMERLPDPQTMLPLHPNQEIIFQVTATKGEQTAQYPQIVRVLDGGKIELAAGCEYEALVIEYHIPLKDNPISSYAINVPKLRMNIANFDSLEQMSTLRLPVSAETVPPRAN